MSGPLHGLKVVELAGLGAAPFCGMVLADLGATVIRVDRTEETDGLPAPTHDLLNRGKQSIAVDLKQPDGVRVALGLVESADVLIEGFRPGVAERIGLGPEVCLGLNPALVYGRLTGWGQDGPLAGTAGHDINYIALSGALGSIGVPESPAVPLNLVGDFGGGGMLLALGVISATMSARTDGVGQVVEAAMVEGSALLLTAHFGYHAEGWWSEDRGTNLLDGSAPFYTTYRTSDGGHMAVGALEPQFYAALLKGLDLDPAELPDQYDRTGWNTLREVFAARFARESRDHWTARFEATDACVTPVLSLTETAQHPHVKAREGFIEVDGVRQPAIAPRFSRTIPGSPGRPSKPGADTDAVLASLGYSAGEIVKLREADIVS